MRKPAICICENKDADRLCGSREADLTTQLVKSLYFLNPKFQASSHLSWPYSPVCVGPGGKLQRPVFSCGLCGTSVYKLKYLLFITNVLLNQFCMTENCTKNICLSNQADELCIFY